MVFRLYQGNFHPQTKQFCLTWQQEDSINRASYRARSATCVHFGAARRKQEVANHKSAKKRYRQDLRRKVRNAARKSRVLTITRKLEKAIKDKDQAAANKLLPQVVSTIMRVRSKGTFKKNTASRKVSRLSKLVHRTFANS